MASRDETERSSPIMHPPRHHGQVCCQCLMDTSDPEIRFDAEGICNHCHNYNRRMREDIPGGDRHAYLEKLIRRIQENGATKAYDCLIGVSGGIDSTYVAWLCKKVFGLRPLALHLDNGWNSELAVQNIEAVLRGLDIDLYTHVIDWEEFRDLQVAFLKAGIANWELPTDHAIRALLYREAARRGIKYILTGSNLATEAVMPASWMADNVDLRLLNSIHSRFGTRKQKTFPTLSLKRLAWYTFVRGIRQIPVLNYVDYHKDKAIALLERELGWRPYEFKHGESLFTRFFQRYYLPRKFGYDKRKPHFSNLVLSGQMTRGEGLEELNKPLYYADNLERDISYVAKKLELTEQQLRAHIDSPPASNDTFPNSAWVRKRLPAVVAFAKRIATARNFTREEMACRSLNLHIYPLVNGLESRIFRITKELGRWATFDRIVILGMLDTGTSKWQRIDDQRHIVRLPAWPSNSRFLPLRMMRFIVWYANCLLNFRRQSIACINCHSLSTLPLGWMLKRLTGAKLIYDTHELETETIQAKGAKRLLAKIVEATFIRSADATIVVGPMIAEWYRARYRSLQPVVVRNLPEFESDTKTQNLFREKLGIPQDDLVFFYQGLLEKGRGVEMTLAAFAHAPRDRHVVFLGFGSYKAIVQEHAARHANIHFLPAVQPHELRNFTQSGDVGLCLIEPSCLSYVYSLPNKLFEYLGAGVPVIVTSLPELSAVVNSGASGWTINNVPEELTNLVANMTRKDILERGANARRWSIENSWQRESKKLQSVYQQLRFSDMRPS